MSAHVCHFIPYLYGNSSILLKENSSGWRTAASRLGGSSRAVPFCSAVLAVSPHLVALRSPLHRYFPVTGWQVPSAPSQCSLEHATWSFLPASSSSHLFLLFSGYCGDQRPVVLVVVVAIISRVFYLPSLCCVLPAAGSGTSLWLPVWPAHPVEVSC